MPFPASMRFARKGADAIKIVTTSSQLQIHSNADRKQRQPFLEREAKSAHIHGHLAKGNVFSWHHAGDELCRCGALRRNRQSVLVDKFPGGLKPWTKHVAHSGAVEVKIGRQDYT